MQQPPAVFLPSYQGSDHEGYDGTRDEHTVGSRWVDIWGIGRHKELDGMMGLLEHFPLAIVHQLKHYRWPDSAD